MYISEVIEKLQKLQKEYGDYYVLINGFDFDEYTVEVIKINHEIDFIRE